MEVDYIGEYVKYLERMDKEVSKGNLHNDNVKILSFDEFKREYWGNENVN